MKYLLIAVAGFLCFSKSYTQTYITRKTADGKAKEWYDKGMTLYQQGDNEKAYEAFDKAAQAAPTFIDAHIQKGAALYDLKKLGEAKSAFEQALQIDEAYNSRVLYTLGLADWQLDDFESSAGWFKRFLEIETKNEALRTKAKRYFENASFAAVAVKTPVPFAPENLGAGVNSGSLEYLPSVTADAETLVFTRRIGRQEDFYVSRQVDGKWDTATPIEEINTDENEGAQVISADGRLLVFTACNRPGAQGSCDLFFSVWRNGRWSKPANIGPPINTKGWESQPSLSADGRTLLFSSDRPGGLGGKDIWISYQQSNGRWSEPVNMGAPINTPYDDQAPYLHADGRTLYFMSNGLPGMGEDDLYVTKWEGQAWSTPQNLGYPINTKASEGALAVSLDGKYAYFTSDRQENGQNFGGLDLFRFELPAAVQPNPVTYVKARVTDAATGAPLEAGLYFRNLETGKAFLRARTAEDGAFLVCLPAGRDYALEVKQDGYLFHSENFALADSSNPGKPYLLEIALQPIPAAGTNGTENTLANEAKPVVLRNVFFETGSAELLPASTTELDQLVGLLQENPTLHIRIEGHTDNVGSDEDNQNLSENRAKSVHNYLIGKSIDAARLSYRGFGETQPIDTNDTTEGRRNNRRTAFVITRS